MPRKYDGYDDDPIVKDLSAGTERPVGKDTLNVLLCMVRGMREDMNLLENQLSKSDLQRVAGQADRKAIDENINFQLQDLTTSIAKIEKRNEEVREVYEDVKSMIKFWHKYWKPLLGGFILIGSAVGAIFKIFKIFK